jgi:hypothetical protein
MQEHLDGWAWGPILQVHEVGDYAIVEYEPNRPGNAKPDWEPHVNFHPFLQLERGEGDWHDTGHSYHTLDRALVAAIAWKHEDREDDAHQFRSTAANSQAVHYFMRMIGAR